MASKAPIEENDGTSLGLTIILASFMIMITPLIAMGMMDYYSVNHTKDMVDQEIKRSISLVMEEEIDDARSANRQIVYDEETLKQKIKETAEEKILKRGEVYKITSLRIVKDEKFYFTWEGILTYKPQYKKLRGFENVPFMEIKTHGRSKVQRFDKEQVL